MKAGYKTTEFWLTALCTICGLLYASGVIVQDGSTGIEKSVAFIASALAALGYSHSRGQAKAAAKE